MVVRRNKQRGFTLLEVLLAGFILFLVLTSMTLVYKGALLSSYKAERSLIMSSAVLPIRRLISDKIQVSTRSVTLSGDGSFGAVTYSWQAILAATGRPSEMIMEHNGDEIQYFLWAVDLRIQQGKMVRSYRFSEISW